MIKITITALVNIILVAILIAFQLKIFNENLPLDYLIDIVLTIAVFTITKDLFEHRKPKAFLNCPECTSAKMFSEGEWKCEKCEKTFHFDDY